MKTLSTNLKIIHGDAQDFKNKNQNAYYQIIIVKKGLGKCISGEVNYTFNAPAILFLSPFETLQFDDFLPKRQEIISLQFHSEFYCIEYHRDEVACNGILFNNIYAQPFIELEDDEFVVYLNMIGLLEREVKLKKGANESILIAYLQVILAKASAAKMEAMDAQQIQMDPKVLIIEQFKKLIELHYTQEKKPSFYAEKLHTSLSNLNKLSKLFFNKSSSSLIQERLILEAKKQLHLSNEPIKNIAKNLNFNDELYFSRFFKKIVNVSPQKYRSATGVVIL